MRRLIIAACMFTLAGASVGAAERDFYLVFDRCSTTTGFTNPSTEGLEITEGSPVGFACTRTGRTIACSLQFLDGEKSAKGPEVRYTIQLDMPPDLFFTDDHAADWFMVNTTFRRAVLITRIVGDTAAGAKVCQGAFATKDDLKAIKERMKSE